jgi:integrase
MRAKAFVSLPVGAVRLAQHKVDQFPRLGVMTKNSKAARTDMLRLGDLERIVQAWDAKVRAAGCELWYPRIDRWRRFMAKERALDYESRKAILNQGIRGLCDRAGVPYLSSHKLRHGHAVYAMRRVKDMKGLKILSQNLMHRSVATTDGIYAPLVGDDAANLYEGMAE